MNDRFDAIKDRMPATDRAVDLDPKNLARAVVAKHRQRRRVKIRTISMSAGALGLAVVVGLFSRGLFESQPSLQGEPELAKQELAPATEIPKSFADLFIDQYESQRSESQLASAQAGLRRLKEIESSLRLDVARERISRHSTSLYLSPPNTNNSGGKPHSQSLQNN